MVLGRNIEQDKTTCREQEWQMPFLLLMLFPFGIFDSDNQLILCPLYKSDLLEYFYDTW